MEYRYKIDVEAGIIQDHLRGQISPEFLISAIRRLAVDPQFNADFANFIDLRECTPTIRFNDFPAIYAAISEVFESGVGRIAILVDDPRTTALTMLMRKNAPSHEISLFSSKEKALIWLSEVPALD